MNKAFVFDFDDTLATTNASILIHGINASRVEYKYELPPSEFNDYELKDGERFDFSEFRCPQLIKNGNPTKLMNLAKQVYDECHSVYILTARSNDVADAITKFLKLHGIEAKQVICVGDKDEDGIASCKQKALLTIMNLYDKTYFYDDNEENVKLADQLGIKAYLV